MATSFDYTAHVRVLATAPGNNHYECKYCLTQFHGSAKRVIAHLYGAKADLLQPHAMRTLAQPASSSSCERGWSTYDFIHSKRRNRLTPERARDLVYVFTNGRLADKMASGEAQEEFVGWDAMAESEDATE